MRTSPFIGLLFLCACGHGAYKPAAMDTDHPITTKADAVDEKLLQPGCYAPSVSLPYLYTKTSPDALAWSQKQPHVVLFWASWCPDCRAVCEDIKSLQGKYPNVEWITVSLDNTALEAKRYLEANGIRGVHLFDGRAWKGDVCREYAVHLHGIPYMYFVDCNQMILWRGENPEELHHTLMKYSTREDHI